MDASAQVAQKGILEGTLAHGGRKSKQFARFGECQQNGGPNIQRVVATHHPEEFHDAEVQHREPSLLTKDLVRLAARSSSFSRKPQARRPPMRQVAI